LFRLHPIPLIHSFALFLCFIWDRSCHLYRPDSSAWSFPAVSSSPWPRPSGDRLAPLSLVLGFW
jgi:hypothetical protein